MNSSEQLNSVVENIQTVEDVKRLPKAELVALSNHLRGRAGESASEEIKSAVTHQAMSLMGRGMTDAKARALRENAKQPRNRESRPLRTFPCTCGKCPKDGVSPSRRFKPLTTCKRGLTIYNRRRNKKPMNP